MIDRIRLVTNVSESRPGIVEADRSEAMNSAAAGFCSDALTDFDYVVKGTFHPRRGNREISPQT